MSDQEGTIHFAYELAPPDEPLAVPVAFATWRALLFRLQLIGQQPNRYGGFAYGNLSMRLPDSDAFVITASQTSGAAKLDLKHLVRVDRVDYSRFWLEASGSEPPSSESLTHAMIYQALPETRWVFHVHNASIWQHAAALELKHTPADVAYGSAAMVDAVAAVLDPQQAVQAFATAGHEDGIFATGHDPHLVGARLVELLARASAIA